MARKGKVGKKLPPLDVTAPRRWSMSERIRFAVAKCGDEPMIHRDLGISARTLARYKSGETAPDEAFLEALAQVAGVPSSWLRAGGHLPNPEPVGEEHLVIRVPAAALVELIRASSAEMSDDVREAIIAALTEG